MKPLIKYYYEKKDSSRNRFQNEFLLYENELNLAVNVIECSMTRK